MPGRLKTNRKIPQFPPEVTEVPQPPGLGAVIREFRTLYGSWKIRSALLPAAWPGIERPSDHEPCGQMSTGCAASCARCPDQAQPDGAPGRSGHMGWLGQSARIKKPLLLLWLFGQFAATGSSAASYQAEEPVSQLINNDGDGPGPRSTGRQVSPAGTGSSRCRKRSYSGLRGRGWRRRTARPRPPQ